MRRRRFSYSARKQYSDRLIHELERPHEKEYKLVERLVPHGETDSELRKLKKAFRAWSRAVDYFLNV